MKETNLDVLIVCLQFAMMDRCVKSTRATVNRKHPEKPAFIEKLAENVRKLTRLKELGLEDDVIAIALAALSASGDKRSNLIAKGLHMIGKAYKVVPKGKGR